MIGFVPYSLSFFGLLSAGMFVMKEAPLETFIAFKSTTPIVISIVDYMFLGRKFPNTKSVFAMLGITVGAVWYVHGDILSGESAYLLCLLFIVFATAEGAIAKDTINRYQLNNWSRTFLMNLISIPIGIVLAMFTGEIGNFSRNEDIMGNQLVWTNRAIITLVCSCVFGVGMGVFTMLIRDALSAASVSVVATCNKFLAEIVNYFIWHNHASLEGAWAVCFIMACGAFYEQAPMRKGENGNFSRKTMLPCLPRSWVLGRSIAIEKPDDVELQQKNAY
jgi:drug/metabolite transporter (DMT)-like permease